MYKNEKKVDLKYGFASVSLRINFDEFVYSDLDKKKALIINNVLQSIKLIHKKAQIDYDKFENDINSFCKTSNLKIQ